MTHTREVRTIEQIVAAVQHYAPAAAPAIFSMLDIDLGPMTPDAGKHFGDVDARIDARRAAERAGADEVLRPRVRRETDPPDTDPAPTPRSSER